MKNYLIIAGETSGDKHAARLVESMKKKENVRFRGVGGDMMRTAGVELLHDVKEMSVMGFVEIVSKLPFFGRVRNDLSEVIRKEKPSAVILVDYPGFNLRFAELAKKNGVKVVYFISPQVWAWGKRRLKKIRNTVDLMMTIFKFEEELYRSENVNAEFIGHPLLDELTIPSENDVIKFRGAYTKNGSTKILALLPGSRLQEIVRILPVMLESVKVLKKHLNNEKIDLSPVLGCAPGIGDEVYSKMISNAGVDAHLSRDVELLMSSADAGLVTSGTATLESALHDLPIIVVYKTSLVTYLIGRMLVKLHSISLVNIVAGRRIVEELIQHDFKPEKAARIAYELLMNDRVRKEIRMNYAELRRILGGPGASERAAELVLKVA